MESMIGQLLSQYERGGLPRRDLIRGLAMLAVGAGAGAAGMAEAQALGDPKLLNIDHVQVNAANVRKSTEFYQKVLGLSVLRVGPANNPTCCPDESAFMGVGKDLMIAIRKATPTTPAGQIDHFGFRCKDFNTESMTKTLAARGAKFSGSYVIDPDGCKVQLSD